SGRARVKKLQRDEGRLRVSLLDLVGVVVSDARHALLELNHTAAQRPHDAREPVTEQDEDHQHDQEHFPMANAEHVSLSHKKERRQTTSGESERSPGWAPLEPARTKSTSCCPRSGAGPLLTYLSYRRLLVCVKRGAGCIPSVFELFLAGIVA